MVETHIDLPKAHRWFGVDLNNRTMDALDAGLITPEAAETYIHAAHACCHHWMQVGTNANHARGEFLVASVYAAAGLGKEALRHAKRCLELVEAYPREMEDWDFAFAYDALARAHAAAGETDAARCARAKAAAAGSSIAESEDRDTFVKWLKGGDWHGLTEE